MTGLGALHINGQEEPAVDRVHARVHQRFPREELVEDAAKLAAVKSGLVTFKIHEQKTPLLPILGWADFLEKGLPVLILGPKDL